MSIQHLSAIPSNEKVSQITTISAAREDFIESKKLKLNADKCHKMHLGKDTKICNTLKVHKVDMDDSTQEKYLGDILLNNGKIDKKVEDRIAKGFGIISLNY